MADFTPVQSGIDYGLINETDGLQEATIYLVNTGDTTDRITRVRTSCGCTLAAYDEKEIAPGDTTWVEVTYNPKGRMGKFEKLVKITDSFRHEIRIPVCGVIKPTEETVKELYPVTVGQLALSTDKIMMADLRMDESKHAFIEIYNTGEEAVTPLLESESEAVEVVGEPRVIEPYNFETYGFYVKTKLADSVGPQKFTINLYPTGDKDEEPFPIELYVNIKEME